MALEENNSGIPATMLVGPAAFGSTAPTAYPVYSQGGMSNGWGDGAWIILLIIVLLAAGGGWGNQNGGGFGGQPIIVNDGNGGSVQRGFDQAATMGGLNGIQSGIAGLSTQLCNGFAGVNSTVSNGFANAEVAANARQMANMQSMFGLQSQFADCCCENRLASADLKYTIATENCADRAASAENTRNIIDSQTRSTQAVLDKLCQLELDNYKRENDQLRTQLNMANLAASQTAQTAQIRDGQAASVNALVNELRSCPIPAQPVYGSQPIFTCPNNGSSGCGCGSF